jgi:hypothetical protein
MNGSFIVSVGAVKDISDNSNVCISHHPQITTDDAGGDHVVWEIHDVIFKKTPIRTVKYAETTLLRERDPLSGKWGDYDEFFPVSGTLALQALQPVYDVYPNIATSAPNYIRLDADQLGSNFDKTWVDWTRLSWNNRNSNHMDMVRWQWGFPSLIWKGASMIEGSLEPAMPQCTDWHTVSHTLLYRSPIVQEDGRYDAKVTQYKFSLTPVKEVSQFDLVWKTIIAKQSVLCPSIKIGGGGGIVSHSGTPIVIPLRAKVNPINDTVAPPPIPTGVTWNDKRTRTQPFYLQSLDTLKYWRSFSLSDDNTSADTTSLKNALIDSNDYIKAKVYLRRNSDSSVVAVLDTAILNKRGFFQSGTASSVSGQYIASGLFISDTLFISYEMIQGNVTNPYQLSLTDVYAHESMLATSGGESFKRAEPQAYNEPRSTDNIKVLVVPNPFQTSTTITVDASKDAFLNISLFDILGRKVKDFVNGVTEIDHNVFTITNEQIPTGSYFLRVQSGNTVVTRKIELVK